MNDEKETSLTPEGFVWFKCNNCECVWQSCNEESDCPECSSTKIDLLEDDDTQN